MNMNRFAALLAGTALVALLAVGCTQTDTKNANAVAANANSNTAVVTNTGTSGVVDTTNTNAARRGGNYNANISQADYEREKDRYAGEARNLGDKVGTTASDGWLWVKARGALAAVDDLRDSTINVDVDNGVITLRGTVANAAQKAAAEKAARSIEGEKNVRNQITVSAGGGGNTNGSANRNARG